MLMPMDENRVSEATANGDGISCLAYQLWEEAGCPEGRDLEFWMGAETRLLATKRPEAVKLAIVAAKASSGKTVLRNATQYTTTAAAHLIS
jgi:hypothetical protein